MKTTKVVKITEEQKLVEFFQSTEGSKFGNNGDYHNWTPAETAIFYMRRLMAIKKGLIEIAREI